MKILETAARFKLLFIIIVVLGLLAAGWNLYHDFEAHESVRQHNAACDRAKLHRAAHHGPLDELTADDAECMQSDSK